MRRDSLVHVRDNVGKWVAPTYLKRNDVYRQCRALGYVRKFYFRLSSNIADVTVR